MGDFDRAAMCEEQRSTQIHQVGRFNFLPLSPPFFPYLFWTQNHSPTTAFKTEFQKKTQLVATYGSIGISPVYPQYIPSSAAAATRPSEGQLGEACGLRGEGGSLLLGRPGWRAPGPLVGGAMGHHGAPWGTDLRLKQAR